MKATVTFIAIPLAVSACNVAQGKAKQDFIIDTTIHAEYTGSVRKTGCIGMSYHLGNQVI